MRILKFGAIWCSTCLTMEPVWQEIQKEMPQLKIESYDFDKNEKMAKKYHIIDLPTFIFINKDEKEIDRIYGEVPKKELTKKILEYKDR